MKHRADRVPNLNYQALDDVSNLRKHLSNIEIEDASIALLKEETRTQKTETLSPKKRFLPLERTQNDVIASPDSAADRHASCFKKGNNVLFIFFVMLLTLP